MTGEEFIPDEVRPGRRARHRFICSPQWALLMQALSDAGYRTYNLLLAHVNTERGDGAVWPQQKSLGAMLGKRGDAISRVVNKELVPLGLVDVETVRYGSNNTRRRNVYTVHEVPPEAWTGFASIEEWYAAHPAQPGDAKNHVSGDPKDRVSGDAKNRVGNKTNDQPDEQENHEAPSARSAGDARRATAGSSAREPRGGSAATSKTARPKKTPKLTRAQVAAVAQVEAALPQTLVERLPYQQLPTSVRHLVAGELEHRTVEQLIIRAARRWEFHGYAKGSFSAEGPNLRRAVGVANALLRAGECPDPGCEDGRIIDTGAECKACPERRARRRAGSAPVPGQRSKAPAWICRSCWAPGKGEAPADLDCRRCRTEAADTCAALEASWKAEMAPAPAEPSAAPQEPAEAPRRPDTAETAPAETDEERAEREEMDRLRAEIAAANPGLAAIAQKANH